MGYNDEFAGPLVFDTETVACPDVESMLDPIRAPSNWKDSFKILTYQQEKLAERIATASLEPDLCEVVAVGVLLQAGHDPEVLTRKDHCEAAMLEWFWQQTANRRLVGYNSLAFDLPVLIRRSQLLGVPHPVVNMDRYRTPHIDLLERLSFSGKITMRSLSFYCRRFGIPQNDVIAGAEIPALVAAGEWESVRYHCSADIQKTALLAERLGWFKAPVHSDAA